MMTCAITLRVSNKNQLLLLVIYRFLFLSIHLCTDLGIHYHTDHASNFAVRSLQFVLDYSNCVGHFTFKFSIALVFKLNFNFQFQVLCKKLQVVSRVFVPTATKSVYYPLDGSLVL